MNTEKIWKLILELDPNAKVLYSDITDKYYVSANIEDGSSRGTLVGICEHRESISLAIEAFWEKIANKKVRLVLNSNTVSRKELRWNDIQQKFLDASSIESRDYTPKISS
jgi:hypothetical protein